MLIVDIGLIDATKVPTEREPLGELVIIDDITGTSEVGNYVVRLRDVVDDAVIVDTRVRGHRRADGWLPLVAKALQALQAAAPPPASGGSGDGEE